MYQTIQKMKASIETIVKYQNECDAHDLQNEIEDKYYKNQTVYLSEKLNDIHQQSKSNILKFIERDEIEIKEYQDSLIGETVQHNKIT